MLNQVVLAGRLFLIGDNGIVIKTKKYKNETDYEEISIKIKLNSNILNTIKEYCSIGSLVGIKGSIDNQAGELVIVAEKVSFLSSNNKEEGD